MKSSIHWNEVKHTILYTANVHSNPTKYIIPMAMEISPPPIDVRNNSLMKESSYHERVNLKHKSSTSNTEFFVSSKGRSESTDNDKSENEIQFTNASTCNNISDFKNASISAMESKELTSFMSTDGENIVFFSRTT